MRTTVLTCLALAAAAVTPVSASAQMTVTSQAELRRFAVTIVRFDPMRGLDSGQTFVLPVDSPDEEHAAASTLSNAISFSKKTEAGRALPVAFMVIKVALRN